MSVSYRRSDLDLVIPKYSMIRDCIEGQSAVKYKRSEYLPIPNSEDTSGDNQSRYEAYLTRAVFYGVTGRTLRGLVGQIFLRDPIYVIPPLLNILEFDTNGEGLDLIQLSKKICTYVMAYGRCGIFIDYPSTSESTSRQDLLDGSIRPIIKVYEPWNIINWRTVVVGAQKLLSLVVLKEEYDIEDDGFETVTDIQWRVIRLTGDGCIVEIWRDTSNGREIVSSYRLCDHTGDEMHEIPFRFTGSETNDSEIDAPPMYDMSILNIAHYRNSADYEESCFITGQPTLWISGLNETWWEDVLNKQVRMGSRGAIPLPSEAEAGLLQSLPNIMPFEAMAHKERQMVAIGAKLIEQRNIERTATETEIEFASDNSVLTTVSKNASTNILWALQRAASFAGTEPTSIEFELNSNFDITAMTSEELRIMVETWMNGALAFSEIRTALKRSNLAVLTDEDAIAEIEKYKDLIVQNQPMQKMEEPGNDDEDEDENEDTEN